MLIAPTLMNADVPDLDQGPQERRIVGGVGIIQANRISNHFRLVIDGWIAIRTKEEQYCKPRRIEDDRMTGAIGWAKWLVWVATIALATAASVDLASAADGFTGQASIIDGDTLEIHGNRIRLWGVDAPETDQLCRGEDSLQYRCGAQAANELDAVIARRPVACLPISLDQYGRTVATCSVGGADLGQWLVQNGLALDWPQYSRGKYGAAQRSAEQAGRGIWKGSYVEPWLYRVCRRANGLPAECSDDANGHP